MKLASLPTGGRDGTLVVVDRTLARAVSVGEIAPTLQAALENWQQCEPLLRAVYRELGENDAGQDSAPGAFDLDVDTLSAPLPRAYQFVDGSAYLAHVERVRRARGAEMPPSFLTDPLMYQAVSDGFLAPTEPIQVASEEYGIDLEAEVCVITDDVPMGATPETAIGHVKLIALLNDVSLRNLIPAELGKGFGFMHSKPRSALSPVAVTPDELGEAWRDGKVHLPLVTHLNGERIGHPDCGVDMQFNFAELIAHAAHTRPLSAGTIVGSGTIANQDEGKGVSCVAERRMLEIIATGEASTPFLSFGDRVKIEMFDDSGNSVFGAINQVVERFRN